MAHWTKLFPPRLLDVYPLSETCGSGPTPHIEIIPNADLISLKATRPFQGRNPQTSPLRGSQEMHELQ